MSVGDVINIDMDGLTAYQPAAGIEIFVLKTFRANTFTSYAGFQNGVTTSSTYSTIDAATTNRAANWERFAITNAEYYYVSVAVVNTGFSGIQIK